MNLPQFLKEVDSTASSMAKGELAGFIHDIARTLPEARRTDFLARLKGRYKEEDNGFISKYQFIKSKLELIENWELTLTGYFNEEYNEWYDSNSDEFIYEDPDGVVDIIEDACKFVHQCIDQEQYKAGDEIARTLLGLQIMVGGDYEDYRDEPMSVSDLPYYHLGSMDYESFVVDAMQGAYWANELQDRADALYRTIENSNRDDITLEMVMQGGRELPDIEEFLPLWIEYLGKLTADSAKRLLKEALELTNDQEQFLVNARKFHREHPWLYEQYLLNSQGKEDERKLFVVGEEALGVIEKTYVVRSRIALLMGRMALHLDMEKEAEACWVEAFRSDTRVVNYFRLLVECRDFAAVEEEVKGICRGLYPQLKENRYSYVSGAQRKENHVSRENIYMLAFLGGEFRYVKENAMNAGNPLGWSMTFMKCGLAAFLLMLMEDECLSAGGREMCRRVVSETGFDKAEYENGILKTIEEGSEEWFWKCWCCWKKTVSLSREEKEGYLQWAGELVAKRVEGIMEGNHRKYYGECAGFIAALGEARESVGERNGKQALMMEYKELYSRRSAFHRELRAYGMADSKKKP